MFVNALCEPRTDTHEKKHERNDHCPLHDRIAQEVAGQGGKHIFCHDAREPGGEKRCFEKCGTQSHRACPDHMHQMISTELPM